MRRGPRLRHDPMKLGTAFGVNADPDDPALRSVDEMVEADDNIVRGEKGDDASNVLDYRNSAMIDFVFLTYVSKTRSKASCS